MFAKWFKRLTQRRTSSGKLVLRSSFARHLIPVACLALFLFARPCAGAGEAKWSVKLDEKIKWYHATFPGVLVIATDHSLRGINPDDGSVLWQLEGRKIKDRDNFWPIYGTPYALLYWGRGELGKYPVRAILDVTNGRELWNTAALGIQEFTGEALLEPIGALLFSGRMAAGKKEGFLMAADLETGQPVWRIDGIFNEKWEGVRSLRRPLYDSGESMIIFNQNRFIRKLNFQTGETVWETKGGFKVVEDPDERKPIWVPGQPEEEKPRKPPERIGPRGGDLYGFAPLLMSTEKERVYVPYHNTVLPVSTADGRALWQKLPALGARVAQMAQVPEGLVVRTITEEMKKEKILLLDAATGEIKWRYPFSKRSGFLGKVLDDLSSKVSNQLGNFVLAGKSVVVVEDTRLLAIDRSSGQAITLEELPTGYNAGTVSLDPRDDGFLLTALQEVIWYDSTLRRVRQVHHKPPDDAAKGAGLLLGTFFLNNALGGPDFSYSGGGPDFSHSIELHTGSVFNYSAGLRAFMRDYHSSSQIEDFFFMLADLEEKEYSGPALLKIDKNTGETVAAIHIKKKEPDYILDHLHEKVFVLSEKKEITCYEW